MISLVATIIILLIITTLVFTRTSTLPGEATYAKFVQEMTNVQTGVYNKRIENAQSGDSEETINSGFTKVNIVNPPMDFQSFDNDEGQITGYLVGLNIIEYDNAEYGRAYAKTLLNPLNESGDYEVIFNKDDVYVFDATGDVYYAKGIEYNSNKIYSLANASAYSIQSTEDGPIIANIVVTSGELANGNKTNAKAKIIISAFPRTTGARLTAMVRTVEATLENDGTYATQVSRNGTYTIVVTEENGGRTVAKVNVTGIIENIKPPTNLSMIINSGDPSTQYQRVNIKVRADGAQKMIIAKNNPLKPNSTDVRWEEYIEEIPEYNLGTIEGRITLYAWFMDEFSNVTDTMVKASIIYDGTPPTKDMPTLVATGPHIIVTSNQTDRVSSKEYLLSATVYGYREYSEYGGYEESDYPTWYSSKLIGGLQNNKTYQVVTKTVDEAGNESMSDPTQIKVSYDYEIVFDLNQGIGTVPNVYASEDEAITMPSEEQQRIGYRFIGWSLDREATVLTPEKIITKGGTYLPKSSDVTSGLTIKFYAIWEARNDIFYTINHYVEDLNNPGTYEEIPRLIEEKEDGVTGREIIVQPKTTDGFEGFLLNSVKSKPLSQEIDGNGTTIFNLYYNRSKYDLTVTAENGVALGGKADVIYEEILQLDSTANTGYEFSRWELQRAQELGLPQETENFLDGVNNPNTRFKMVSRDEVAKAVYIARKYKITYYLKGGIIDGANPVEYTKETESFTLINPTKLGYTFTGWIGTDIEEPQLEVTLAPNEMIRFEDREYTATYTPAEDLLTMTATPSSYTNKTVRVTARCLDPELTIEHKVGENGTWERYVSTIEVEYNTTVYSRVLEEGVIVDQETLVVNNIDRELPVIENISISDEWIPGTILKLKVNARDNIGVESFATSSNNSEPMPELFIPISGEAAIKANGLNYVWVKDLAGNVGKEIIYAWDISEDETEEVYATIFKNTNLVIAGEGATKTYTSVDTPYEAYKSYIKDIEIQEGVTKISDNVLTLMDKVETIYIPGSLNNITDDAMLYTNSFRTIVIATNNNYFTYENSTLYNKAKTKIYVHSKRDETQTYIIPVSVTEIAKYAFYDNDTIKKVIANGNPSLGESAFENCSELIDVEGKIGGISIKNKAFADCTNLEVIQLSSTLEEIGYRAFYNTNNIKVITIPKTVTRILDIGGAKEVFREIGIYAGNPTNRGIVRYYQSCLALNVYARENASEATFEMIDDVPATLLDFKIESPETGVYSWGQQIKFVAEFDENINATLTTTLPSITLKIGNGVEQTISAGEISENEIIYTYTVPDNAEGVLTLIRYEGIVYDVPGNITNVYATTVSGSEITINTCVRLEESGVVTYYTKLQHAIDAAKISPENTSQITLLKNITESVAIRGNKDIDIDLNGKTITSEVGKVAVMNYSKLNIRNGGEIISSNRSILENISGAETSFENIGLVGTSIQDTGILNDAGARLILDEVTMSGQFTGIENVGTLTMNNCTLIVETDHAIKTNGTSVTNINGGTIEQKGNELLKAAIYISENSTMYIDGADVISNRTLAIENRNLLEIRGVSTIYSQNFTAILNARTMRMYAGEVTNDALDKETINNTGTLNIYGGSVNAALNIAIKNNGILTLSDALVSSRSLLEETIFNLATKKATITNSQVTSMYQDAINNEGILEINAGTIIKSLGKIGIFNKLLAEVTINSGDVISSATDSTVIYNQGKLKIEDARLSGSGEYGIYDTGSSLDTIKNANIIIDSPTSNVVGIYAGNNNITTIENINMNLTARSGNATGIRIIGNEVDVTSGTVNVTSTNGSGFGIYNEQGILLLGKEDMTTNEMNPRFEGSTHGYYSEDGQLYFYDGCLVGSIGQSLMGEVTRKPMYGFLRVTQIGSRESSVMGIDFVKPANVTLTANTYNWTNAPVTLTGEATEENSGIAAYAFSEQTTQPLENEWVTVANAPLTILQTTQVSQRKTMYFYVKDKAGNIGVSNAVDVKYDNELPTIINIWQEPDEWSSSDVEVYVAAEDTISGVAAYHFTTTPHGVDENIDDYTRIAPKNTFTKSIMSGNGIWYIYIMDQAGNVSSGEWTVRHVDKEPPEVTVRTSRFEEGYSEIIIEAIDNESGVTRINVNGQEIGVAQDEETGIYYAYYQAREADTLTIEVKDLVGNTTIVNSEVYVLAYHANGGQGETKYRFKLKNESIAFIENTFTKTGYQHAGWRLGENTENPTIVQPGELYNTNASVNLYAIWIDVIAPEILDVKLSENWTTGENAKIKIIATDNSGVTGYAITGNTTEPSMASMQASSEFNIVSDGKYYMWVTDIAGNMASGDFYLYNASGPVTNNNVYAIIKNNTETASGKTLSIEGNGATGNYLDEETVPWYEEREIIGRLEIKPGITGIGNKALSNLSIVKEIVIESTVEEIEDDAFIHSNNFTDVYINGSNFVYSNGMIQNGVQTVIYAASTVEVPPEIIIPERVERFGPYAFENTPVQRIIMIPNINISEGVFKNASNLRVILAERGIGGTSIGNSAFEGCSSLGSLNISKTLETVGEKVFYNCISIINITMPKTIITMPTIDVFKNIGISAETATGKAYVYYYESNTAMTNYATSPITQDEATFINIDDIPPVVESVIINSGDYATPNRNVKVALVATDNHTVAQIYMSEDSDSVPAKDISGWLEYEDNFLYDYLLTQGNGVKTIYVWAKDDADNISIYNSDSIILAEHEFNFIGSNPVIQYKDTTPQEYYEFREQGYNFVGENFIIEKSGTVNNQVTGHYEIVYNVSYMGELVGTYIRNVEIIENTWNTEEIEDSGFRYVLHEDGNYAKLVGIIGNRINTLLQIPSQVTVNGTIYKVIDIGNGENSIAQDVTEEEMTRTLIIPETVIAISDYAFGNFKNINAIEYGYNLMTIGKYAFTNWATYSNPEGGTYLDTTSTTTIENLVIKENVREVKEGAFDKISINNLIIEDGVKAIYENAFRGRNGINRPYDLIIPNSIEVLGSGENSPFVFTRLTSINVESENIGYKSIESGKGLMTIDGNVYMQYSSENVSTVYTLPNGTVKIGAGAFAESNNLQKVILPNTINEISKWAFQDSGLTEFTIPAFVTQINESVFENTKIVRMDIQSTVTRIKDKAFANIEELLSVVIHGTPEIAGTAFAGDLGLGRLIMLDTNNKSSITSVVAIPTGLIVYVPTVEMEILYEEDATWGELGTERIDCLYTLNGEAVITLEYGDIYTEYGVNIFEELIPTGSGEGTLVPGFATRTTNNINTENTGTYFTTYTLSYNGEDICSITRTIEVIDKISPEIISVETSDTWVPGTPLKLELTAEDEYDGSNLTYTITTIEDTTSATWSSSNILTILGEDNFLYVRDNSHNETNIRIKAWDISKNSGSKQVYAYLTPDGLLRITGNGETYGVLEGNSPWKNIDGFVTDVEIEEGVTALGEYILSNLNLIDTIKLPSSLSSIAGTAFAYSNNYNSIEVANEPAATFKVIDGYMLVDKLETTIYVRGQKMANTIYEIPETYREIKSFAFYQNTNLTESLTVWKGINTLGEKIFIGVPGTIYYYASCEAMRIYATMYEEEADFQMIDDVTPNTEAPTLRASSSVIIATSNQTDNDSEIASVLYNIRSGEASYDEANWQSQYYFTGLKSTTTYYVKTRATDTWGNVSDSEESWIETEEVPKIVSIMATPITPTSGDVLVTIEWPQVAIDLLYGDGWPEGTDVIKQVGVKESGDASITWTNIPDQDSASTIKIVTKNYTTVYARLFDGVNYTTQTISLTVTVIDRIGPTGTVEANKDETLIVERT